MTTKQTNKTRLGIVLSDKIQDFQVNLNFKSTMKNLLVEMHFFQWLNEIKEVIKWILV